MLMSSGVKFGFARTLPHLVGVIIGFAAVADALNLQRTEFEPDLSRSIERGEFYLLPDRSHARAEMVA